MNYKDWTIEVFECEHPNFGRGFTANAYVAKTNGLKANIHTFGRFDNIIKTKKAMYEYVKNALDNE